MGRDQGHAAAITTYRRFQSTRPVWGATRLLTHSFKRGSLFQSTRPVWGATMRTGYQVGVRRYFNPRAPCGARRSGGSGVPLLPIISIHAPRVGRDCAIFAVTGSSGVISIHAPRVGRDVFTRHSATACRLFQSTRPVWGATETSRFSAFASAISIHAPRVGRDTSRGFSRTNTVISIHAPRVGRDDYSRS